MKNKILGWLFKGYAHKLKEASKDDIAQAVELQLEAYKRTLDIKDLIRSRFRGIRPQRPDEESLLDSHMRKLSETELMAFLSKAKDIIENPTFKMVTTSLILESIEQAALESEDMVSVNFNRASVNGVQLVEDTLTLLDKQYHELQELQQKMTEEERLSAL